MTDQRDENRRNLSRPQFLRASAFGALGALGAGAVAVSGAAPALAAPAPGKRGYVVTVTHGVDDPSRVMLALVTATKLPRGDNHVWFAIDGGRLCRKGEAEKVTSPLFVKQGSAARLLGQIRDQGTAIHI